jgi:hypothetical protein
VRKRTSAKGQRKVTAAVNVFSAKSRRSSKKARKQESKKARKQESKKARKQESKTRKAAAVVLNYSP